jgi:CRP-like cAMP-binding protein
VEVAVLFGLLHTDCLEEESFGLKTWQGSTIGILGDGNFFGEGSLSGQPLPISSATTKTDCAILRIDKKSHDGRASSGT